MNLFNKVNALFFKPNTKEPNMSISLSVIENLTSYLLTAIVNEISAHSTKISAMNLQADVTPAELDAANQKLLGLLNTIAPFENMLTAKFPQLVPLVNLAQSYVTYTKE
jgi:hypothetical protein